MSAISRSSTKRTATTTMEETQEWKLCAQWLVRCGVLAPNHVSVTPLGTTSDLARALRDGTVICNLARRLNPDSLHPRDVVQKPGNSKHFSEKNIRIFLHACREKFGLKDTELFQPSMLFDMTDFGKVVKKLSILSKTSYARTSGIQGFPRVEYYDDPEDLYNGLDELSLETGEDAAERPPVEANNYVDESSDAKYEQIYETIVEVPAKVDEDKDYICDKLGILEKDYFGIQYTGKHGEPLWINNRNKIAKQVNGKCPYRLRFRVKFYVPPHRTLQNVTRRHFYNNIRHDLNVSTLTPNDIQRAKLCALVAQIEYGDFNHSPLEAVDYSSLVPNLTKELLTDVIREHQELKGISNKAAVYHFIQLASDLPGFGIEYFHATTPEKLDVILGIGANGVFLYHSDLSCFRCIQYPLISKATNTDKYLCLNVLFDEFEDSSDGIPLRFRLISEEAAEGAYRSVTEKHTFYRTDTVSDEVNSQVSRDFKGALIALFNEDTNFGTKYVFDIKRTSKEAYDHVRRILFTRNSQIELELIKMKECLTRRRCDQLVSCCSPDCQQARDELNGYRDLLLCRVCMDGRINTVFLPCKHAICCTLCADQVPKCPICRGEIADRNAIYFPSFDH